MKYIVLFFTLVPLICASCVYDPAPNRMLSIINNSHHNIAVLESNGMNEAENNVAFYITDRETIKPDSSFIIEGLGNDTYWHDYIKEGKFKKLFIYVFDVDTLKKYYSNYSIQSVMNDRYSLQKLEFSEKQLIQNNWKIQFKK